MSKRRQNEVKQKIFIRQSKKNIEGQVLKYKSKN